jgi:MFS family permease
VVGAGSFFVAYLLFAASGPGVLVLLVAFVLAGLGIGFAETAEAAAVASMADESVRGSAFGLLAGAQSLGNFAASAIGGILWTLVSPTMAFVWLAAWMAIACVAFLAHHETGGTCSRGATEARTTVTAPSLPPRSVDHRANPGRRRRDLAPPIPLPRRA